MLLKNPQTRFEEFNRIYKESFPAIERRTTEGQKEVLESPYYRVRVIEEEGKILAFVGYWNLPNCVFIEHLATTEACRGKGYGKILIEECLSETEKPIFLEIEPIKAENPMTRRREKFYERLGFCTNTFFYQQMPLKVGDAPLSLWVMSYGNTISEERFLPYKREIYEIVYQII